VREPTISMAFWDRGWGDSIWAMPYHSRRNGIIWAKARFDGVSDGGIGPWGAMPAEVGPRNHHYRASGDRARTKILFQLSA
jgi:hypothetical protein